MSSKSKAFQFGSKRSQSLSTSSKLTAQSAAEHLKTKRSQFAMLASLPFRYAFTNNSLLIKQNSNENGGYQSTNLIRSSIDESNSEVGVSEENLAKQPSFSSSDIEDYNKPISLIFNREDLTKQVSLPENHDYNLSNVLDEEEPAEVEQKSVSFISIEDEKTTSQGTETKMNSSSAVNTSITQNKEGDEVASAAKKSAIRRHHSAPQSEAKWLQVFR